MKRSPIKRKSRLSPVSKKRSVEMKEYSRLRKEFLAQYPVCYVWWDENAKAAGSYKHLCDAVRMGFPNPWPSNEVHHVHKRGKNYLDTSTWMAVSSCNHQRIENNKSWARQNGYLANI